MYMSEDSDKIFFDALEKNREEAENAIGTKMEWRRLDGKKASTIDVYKLNCDFSDASKQQDVFAWYKEYTERFIKYFKPIIKKL